MVDFHQPFQLLANAAEDDPLQNDTSIYPAVAKRQKNSFQWSAKHYTKLFFIYLFLFFFNRNYGMGDTHVKTDVKTLKHQKSEYSLSVGKHSVTVSYNKRAIALC